MSNPYAGIITSEFKTMYDNAIDALLEDTALTVPCRLEYNNTKNVPCSNCELDPINKRSANVYKSGGASPFVTGSICPTCNGVGFISASSSSTFNMAVLWNENKSKFLDIGLKLDNSKIYAQSICHSDRWPAIVSCQGAILNTNIEGFGRQKYQREGDPTPFTFGHKTYIITLWSRIH
jgi:hypothetical protein